MVTIVLFTFVYMIKFLHYIIIRERRFIISDTVSGSPAGIKNPAGILNACMEVAVIKNRGLFVLYIILHIFDFISSRARFKSF